MFLECLINVEFPTVAYVEAAGNFRGRRTSWDMNHSSAIAKSEVSVGRMGSEMNTGQVAAFHFTG